MREQEERRHKAARARAVVTATSHPPLLARPSAPPRVRSRCSSAVAASRPRSSADAAAPPAPAAPRRPLQLPLYGKIKTKEKRNATGGGSATAARRSGHEACAGSQMSAWNACARSSSPSANSSRHTTRWRAAVSAPPPPTPPQPHAANDSRYCADGSDLMARRYCCTTDNGSS